MDNKNKRRQLIGKVSSNNMDKTVVVMVQKKIPHPTKAKEVKILDKVTIDVTFAGLNKR